MKPSLFIAALLLPLVAVFGASVPINNAVFTGTINGAPTGGTLDFTLVNKIGFGVGSGTVTSIPDGSTNGVTWTVATRTTTPTFTFSLGAIAPLSIAATGTVTGSNLSGTNTGDQTITLTGDVTGSGPGSFATTLANTGVSANTYGSATAVPALVIDAKGRIVGASNVTITATGNVTAAGTLDSGNIVIGQGVKTVATSSTLNVAGSNVTITGNQTVTGSQTIGNLITSTLNVTGCITSTGVTNGLLWIGNATSGNFEKGNVTGTGNVTVSLSPASIGLDVTALPATAVTVADAGGYFTGTNAETALQEAGANIVALQQATGPPPSGNQLISGGGVALAPGGGLDVTVSAATYIVQGVGYSSALTNLTLAAADPTDPRIDVIAVNSSGAAVVIQGTAGSTPAKPDVDPSTQLELTFFIVQAMATDLDVDVVNVYLNNAEWTTTQSGGTINTASTNNPYTGSVCIEGTSVTTGNYVQFVKPASGTFDLVNSDNLVFYIRSKASWATNRLMTITVRNSGGTQLGSAVTFDQGIFGFNSGQTTTYQQIIIPTALFSASGQTATTIRMAVGGSGGTIGWYIDDVTLQGGVASIIDSSRMKWRGPYVASNFYNVNDAVLSGTTQYVAIQAGVGNTPASSPTFWQASSGIATITLTGDVTGSGTGSFATTLASTAVTAGTYGSATAAPVIIFDAKGRATSASNVTITPAIGSITGLGAGVGTFLVTPSITNFNSMLTGATVFSNITKTDIVQAGQFAADAAASDTYVITLSPAISAYTTGTHYTFTANTSNTGAATININGLGAKTIVKVAGGITTTLADNDIRAGQVVDLAYDGTNMQLQSLLGNAAGGGTTLSMTATLGSDDTYTGSTLAGLNAGATIAQWEAVYLGGSSTWLLADANGSGTYPARGLAVAAYSNTDPAVIIREGPVRNDAWNWTPGGTIYLSETPGAITQTMPSTAGTHVQQVGFALTADIAYFNFASGEYVTVPP